VKNVVKYVRLNIKNMKKIILLTLTSLIFISCNPMLHVIGNGMRKMNIKQNKYSSKKPYIKS
jgi:hypothetical protein